MLCSLAALSVGLDARGQMAAGHYIGDGTDNRNIGDLSFQPNFICVKQVGFAAGKCRTSTMSGDAATIVHGGGLETNNIQAILTNGFQVGTDTDVNNSGSMHVWAAFKAVSAEFAVGSYEGNGADSRNLAPTGFTGITPAFVHVFDSLTSSGGSWFRYSTQSGDLAFNWGLSVDTANMIQGFYAGGFQVGTDNDVNDSDEAFHYVAWKAVAAEAKAGSFTGNGADNRNIAGVGFRPAFVALKFDGGQGVWSQGTLQSDTYSLPMTSWIWASNYIQGYTTDGFQVGSQGDVNQTTTAIHYFATAYNHPSAVRLAEFTARRTTRGTLLSWRTGVEEQNVGFHIYRERNGERHRITPSVVAGSGLSTVLGAQRPERSDGRSYAWLDATPSEPGDRYILEDIEFGGTRTLHEAIGVEVHALSTGPMASPSAPTPTQALEELENSPLLRRLSELSSGVTGKPKARVARGAGAAAGGVAMQLRSADVWAIAHEKLMRGAAVKIGISEQGYHTVSFTALRAAGLSASAKAERLQLFVDGKAVSMDVTGDGIGFYGEGVDTPYTGSRYYWLVELGAGEAPKRLQPAAAGGAAAGPGPLSFEMATAWQDRSLYVAGIANGEGNNFFGALMYDEPMEHRFLVKHGELTQPGSVEVSLQGTMFQPHVVGVVVNGERVGAVSFSDRAQKTERFAVAAGILKEGENVVRLVSETPSVSEGVSLLLDRMELRYPRQWIAEDDQLMFPLETGKEVTVGGFGAGGVRVLDVTDADAPFEVSVTETPGAVGSVTVVGPSGKAGGSGESTKRVLWAMGAAAQAGHSSDASKTGTVTVTSHQAGAWQAEGFAGAAFVIVAPSSMTEAMEPLAKLRRQEGWTVEVVAAESLYDAFGYGAKSPWAIRGFLESAVDAWATKPTHVLLVGDSTWDPRNHTGLGDGNVLPTKLVDTKSMETASDEWFVDFDDDGVGELAIGRLPAKTADEAKVMVDKILTRAPVLNRAVFLSGKHVGHNFEEDAEEVAKHLPADVPTVHLSAERSGSTDSKAALLRELDRGVGLVTLMGHGTVTTFPQDGILASSEAGAMLHGQLPLFVNLTCFTGMFQDLFNESLAESLMRSKGGGALAVWASSGYTFPADQKPMAESVFSQLGDKTLGEAVREAKTGLEEGDVKRTWILFGDPTLRFTLEPEGGGQLPSGCTCRLVPVDTAGPAPTHPAWWLAALGLGVWLRRAKRR